jgi:hypothetical protein
MVRQPHDRSIQLSSTLSWLIDAAAESAGADRLLAELGAHLVDDGLPLAVTTAASLPLTMGFVLRSLVVGATFSIVVGAHGRGEGARQRSCRRRENLLVVASEAH